MYGREETDVGIPGVAQDGMEPREWGVLYPCREPKGGDFIFVPAGKHPDCGRFLYLSEVRLPGFSAVKSINSNVEEVRLFESKFERDSLTKAWISDMRLHVEPWSVYVADGIYEAPRLRDGAVGDDDDEPDPGGGDTPSGLLGGWADYVKTAEADGILTFEDEGLRLLYRETIRLLRRESGLTYYDESTEDDGEEEPLTGEQRDAIGLDPEEDAIARTLRDNLDNLVSLIRRGVHIPTSSGAYREAEEAVRKYDDAKARR